MKKRKILSTLTFGFMLVILVLFFVALRVEYYDFFSLKRVVVVSSGSMSQVCECLILACMLDCEDRVE